MVNYCKVPHQHHSPSTSLLESWCEVFVPICCVWFSPWCCAFQLILVNLSVKGCATFCLTAAPVQYVSSHSLRSTDQMLLLIPRWQSFRTWGSKTVESFAIAPSLAVLRSRLKTTLLLPSLQPSVQTVSLSDFLCILYSLTSTALWPFGLCSSRMFWRFRIGISGARPRVQTHFFRLSLT